MPVRKYYEIECESCGCCSHFPIGVNIKYQARSIGWIVSKYGYLCSMKCLEEIKFLNEAKNGKRSEAE